ncbi:ATP-binding protein [Bacillus marasmi]|uniref:ATP-binding protein n=1 Tax=Bacillus marasmi TaxID=1926279 RepID=UPI00164E6B62|nr:ATP-binding protein [Bacillus marasmi]
MDRKLMVKRVILQLVIMLYLHISSMLLSMLIQHLGFSEVCIVVIYLLSVLITSRYTQGYTYGIIASFFSMLSFNFFFTGPRYTFKVDDTNYLFTLMIMLMASIFTSALTSKLIRSKELANEKEKLAQLLYQITSMLAKTGGVAEVAKVSVQCLSNLLHCEATLVVINSKLNKAQIVTSKMEKRVIEATDVNMDGMKEITADQYTFPIKVHDKIVCFVCLPKEFKNLSSDKKILLDSAIMQITIAMERELLTSEKEAAKGETERERLKSHLLRVISHDIRTPLTGITGAAEILLHHLNNDEEIKLVEGIYEDSCWLTRLVENILSLTRIQEGRLTVNIQQEAVEEIVAEAIYRAAKYAPHHNISSTVPDEVLFVPMDGKLIEQVLINLIENAIKHTSTANEIAVLVQRDDDKVWFSVSDNGTGLNEADIPKLFDMFFVANSSPLDSKRGIGLGLAICKAIVTFHGGEIFAENNRAGGSTFRFYLNMKD